MMASASGRYESMRFVPGTALPNPMSRARARAIRPYIEPNTHSSTTALLHSGSGAARLCHLTQVSTEHARWRLTSTTASLGSVVTHSRQSSVHIVTQRPLSSSLLFGLNHITSRPIPFPRVAKGQAVLDQCELAGAPRGRGLQRQAGRRVSSLAERIDARAMAAASWRVGGARSRARAGRG